MKRNVEKKLSALIALLLCLCCATVFASCGNQAGQTESKDVWEDATYTADTSFGEGSKTVAVEVIVESHSVTFTIKTDKTTVGDALLEHSLIAGDQGQFGLYVKVVNGITADYDINQTYWTFNINGEMAMSGVDAAEIADGAVYQLVYTK